MKKITRKSFLRSAAIGAVSLGAVGLAGTTFATDTTEYKWDYETEVVVVGSGCGIMAALMAAYNGAKVILLEKAGTIGGTTIRSGGIFWVPSNHCMVAEGYGEDYEDDEILQYLRMSDALGCSSDSTKLDFIQNARKAFQYMDTAFGLGLCVNTYLGDYYDLPYQKLGRSISCPMSASAVYTTYFLPALETYGVEILTETAATELIQDTHGTVIGLKAQAGEDEINIRAEKGVILCAGGFDYDNDMCRAFLRGPIYGSSVIETNTGDGIKMSMMVGAALGAMASTVGGNVYIMDPQTMERSPYFDFSTYRGSPHSLIVSRKGRRFANESCSYAVLIDAFYNYDTSTFAFNIPAYLIFSQAHVDFLNGLWPDGSTGEKPDWVDKFDTLDDLAAFYGIDVGNLKDEVEKFNGYCEAGADPDFHRGEGPYEKKFAATLGKVEAPYYVALTAPASLGTKGGLCTNFDGQVFDAKGNIIPGLYAAGTNAAPPLGASYGGAGGSNGPNFYQAFRAAQHALGIQLI